MTKNSSTATNEDGDKLNHVGIKNGPSGKIIEFDKEKTEKLRTAYDEAVRTDAEVFEVEGMQLVREYAKYLLEYLDGRLK